MRILGIQISLYGSVTAPSRAEDSVEMARLVFGDEFVKNNCVLVSLINANSPMTWDDTMLGALKVYARAGQACIVSPFILAGAMSPVSVAGTLTQILAEAMSGIALTQIINPGVPVIFGSFASRYLCRQVHQRLALQNSESIIRMCKTCSETWCAI